MAEDASGPASRERRGTPVSTPAETEALLHAVDSAVLRAAPDGTVQAATDRLLAPTSWTREELVGRPVAVLFQDGCKSRVQGAIRGLPKTDADATTIDVTLATADGGGRSGELRLGAVRSGDEVGGVVGVFCQSNRDCVAGERLEGDPAEVDTEVDGRGRSRHVGAPLGTGPDGTGPRDAREQLDSNAFTLEQLSAVTADRDRTVEEKIGAILDLGRERLGLPVGFLAEIDPDDDRFEVVQVDGDDDRLQIGTTAPLSETYCRRAVDTDGLVAATDASTGNRTGDGDQDRASLVRDVGCYVGGTVEVEGERYGALCFESENARSEPFSGFERTFVALATQWIGQELERERHERRLERYRTYTDDVLDAIEDVVYVIDEQGNVERWNETVPAVFGYDAETVAEMHATDFFPESERDFVASKIATVFEEGSARMETEIETADGEQIPYEYSAARLEDPEGNPVLAGIGRDVSERRERERELEAQRERLAALNSLHEVVGEITDTVIEQSTREEIEDAVCRRLADSASYSFAWIGEVEAATERVVPRRSAGAEGFLDGVEMSIDAEDPQGRGPAGRAVRSGEVETTPDVLEDPAYGPWRERALDRGVRSSAAIPISHEGTVFGVLNVYAGRPDAFTGEERQVLTQLGEIVGHAITAVERKRAIMGDEVVELEVRISRGCEDYGLPESEGTITVDRVVPATEDEFLVYGRATGDATAVLDATDETAGPPESVTVTDEGDHGVCFEVRTRSAPVVETVVDQGGVVERAAIEGGDFYLTVHLPEDVDVRSVVEALEAKFDAVEPLARRQIQKPGESDRNPGRTLLTDLTDRQRTALETAYFGGFYEWPRDSTAEELAEQLDIAPATLAQHLRTAERKLLDAVLEEVPAGR